MPLFCHVLYSLYMEFRNIGAYFPHLLLLRLPVVLIIRLGMQLVYVPVYLSLYLFVMRVAAEKALGRDRYFLYNYAAELYTAHLFSESLANAIKCRSLWSDYDLEMLIGQNYMELEQMKEAEEHFKLASDMCPNRFMPLYRLVHLFDRQGRVLEAKKIATAIVSKKVKIPSATVERIKSEMKDYLTIKS